MKLTRMLILLVLPLLIPAALQAGQYGPVFAEEMDLAKAGDEIHGLVFLADALDPMSVAEDLSDKGHTLAVRHEAVIRGLMDKASDTQYEILQALDAYDSRSVKRVRSFWIANAIEVLATKSVFEKLVKSPQIAVIRAVPPLELIEPVHTAPSDAAPKGIENGIADTRAPEVWALGYEGATAIVCDVDTGAQGDHPAFGDRWLGLFGVPADQAWYDPVTQTTFPFDAGSHGTHTLGTMIGDDGQGNQIGMAPKARWIAAGVIDRVSIGQTLVDAFAAFEWAADPDGNPSTFDDVPDVINNSWGYRSEWGYPVCDDFMWPVIDAVEAAGAVVVFAAGNEGSSGLRIPGNRISTDVNVFSVGALKQNGTKIASFSSKGPSDCDGQTIKPEVSAIGDNVRSSIPNNNYSTMSGTSMATPHVAGAVALLRDAVPESLPVEIKMALYETAVDLGPAGEDNTFGKGKIDVYAAVQYLIANVNCDYDQDGFDRIRCGGTDCDDLDENVHPGADEICDGKDSNCDGTKPPDEADEDGDGQGICHGDCDDTNPEVYDGAPELCDGLDNNCDELPDEIEVDNDGDSYSECDGDCNDENDQVHPGAEEVCDGQDTNCDGEYPFNDHDFDKDGFPACAGDCEPFNGNIYPGAPEGCDMKDSDCDGLPAPEEQDPDRDGAAECEGDCEPDNPAVYPGKGELCNGFDDNCDGVLLEGENDPDGDGFWACLDDCGPDDPNTYPGATEICDNIDNDCDGQKMLTEIDADRDLTMVCAGDCNDNDPNVRPNILEDCENGIDDNCDGLIDQDDPVCAPADDDDSGPALDDDDTEASKDETVSSDECCGGYDS